MGNSSARLPKPHYLHLVCRCCHQHAAETQKELAPAMRELFLETLRLPAGCCSPAARRSAYWQQDEPDIVRGTCSYPASSTVYACSAREGPQPCSVIGNLSVWNRRLNGSFTSRNAGAGRHLQRDRGKAETSPMTSCVLSGTKIFPGEP